MSRRFDEMAKGAADRAQAALQFLLFQGSNRDRAIGRRFVLNQKEHYR